VAAALGKPFMPWQQFLADLALECDDSGHLVYREVRVTVPRQSGKSTLVLAKNVQRMIDAKHFGGRQRLVYTAQDRLSAKAKLMDDWAEDLRTAKRFAGRWKPRRTIGEESIRWQNGSIWGVQSNKETAGHGGTLDVGDLDEAFAHVDDRVEQALSPAQVTRRDAQLWVISTAGTIERSLYLKGKVDSGRELAEAGIDRGVCYVEYSANPDADLDDPATWWTFMPALGFTTTEDVIAAERSKMTPAGFARAYGNLWVPARYGDQVIPADNWNDCRDEDSQIVGRTYVVSVDVAPGSSWASIAVAGYRADGLPHAEVVEHNGGDDWVIRRVLEIIAPLGGPRRVPVWLDPTSPAGALLSGFREKKVEPNLVGARELAQACGEIKSKTLAGAWRHIGQTVLSDALKGAATRQLLDSWAWKRTSSSCDISPLVAITIALHGLSVAPKQAERTEEELLASVG
jgi:phage terminase large subunit-like protein